MAQFYGPINLISDNYFKESFHIILFKIFSVNVILNNYVVIARNKVLPNLCQSLKKIHVYYESIVFSFIDKNKVEIIFLKKYF